MRISDWSSDVCSSDLPIIYLNRVGGQDELVFDGASFILSAEGDVVHRLPEWGEAIVQTHWSRNMHGRWVCAPGERAVADPYPEDIYSAMVLGLRDYVNRNRFPEFVLGLWGGIDNALSAAVAVDAPGADVVWVSETTSFDPPSICR